MNEILQAIADHFKKNDPDDADFYTLGWARDECAFLNKSPDEYLAYLQANEARAEAANPITEDQAWTKDLPPHYIAKFGGPIDGFSYGLMKESGELAEFETTTQKENPA